MAIGGGIAHFLGHAAEELDGERRIGGAGFDEFESLGIFFEERARIDQVGGAQADHRSRVGVLLGGVPGVLPGKVVILGGGVAGTHAAQMAVGLHADVTVVDRSIERLRELSDQFGSSLRTAYSTAAAIERLVKDADLVIGAVLIAGAAAPKLVTRAMLSTMQSGSVLVDIAIDQGGCFETSKPTPHAEPTFVVDGVVHYCVANMPGAVARTSTFALTNATLPYVRQLADLGWQAALRQDPGFAAGLNVHAGGITHPAVAQSLGIELAASPLQGG